MDLMEIVKTIGMTKDEVLKEAETVEAEEDWSYSALIGYSAKELREVAERMEEEGSK